MALAQLLYTGHFVPEEGYVRFQGHQPVVTRPISMSTVRRLLKTYLSGSPSPDSLPEEWGMSILPDYIVCFRNSPPEALRFLADYAQQQGATLLDMGSFSLLAAEQLRQPGAERLGHPL